MKLLGVHKGKIAGSVLDEADNIIVLLNYSRKTTKLY